MKRNRSGADSGRELQTGMRRNANGRLIAALLTLVRGLNFERHATRDRLCPIPNGQDRT